MKEKIKKLKNNAGLPAQAGMTLFIAVIIMSILLFISFAVMNITLKATLFASSGRDSQYAFYAADAGLECALYWDTKFDSFATSTVGNEIICAHQNISTNSQIVPTNPTRSSIIGGIEAVSNPITPNTSIFYFDMKLDPTPLPYCAIVMVEKRASDGKTYIESRGYNTCDAGNLRRVERGIEVNY